MATLMEQDVLQELASGIACHLINVEIQHENNIPSIEKISEKHTEIIYDERNRIFHSNTEDLNFMEEVKNLRQLEKAFFVEIGLTDYWQKRENARLEKFRKYKNTF